MIDVVAPESVGFSKRRLGRIRPWMEHYVDEGRLAGAITLVARQGQVALLELAGYSDYHHQTPLSHDSLFRFYSMTKPVTAVAVMMLYEEGHFLLDDPLSAFIPAFKDMVVYRSGPAENPVTVPAREPITIHHLLTHTAGFTYGFGNEGTVPELYLKHRTDFNPGDGTLDEAVQRLAQIPLGFHPGSRWGYGVAYDVLGRLVEVVSGQSLDTFFRERIFAPLEMHDTSFGVPPFKRDRLATLYEKTENEQLSVLESAQETPVVGEVDLMAGGSGLISSLEDYYRFAEMLRLTGEFDGERLLGRKTVEYMMLNHLPGDLASMGQPVFCETSYAGIGFGLGGSVVLDPTQSQTLSSVGEFGWGGYASTAFWVDPQEELTVIFLTQLIPSDAYPLRRELRVLTYQALTD